MSKSALLERPESRVAVAPERVAIARVAEIIAYILVATAIALGLSATLLDQQSLMLGSSSREPGAMELLTLGGLALVGAVSAGVAAVSQRPRRLSSWIALVASGLALLALVLASTWVG
jgi:hypothetical protein